jgi:hypothetical protein
MLFSTQKKYKTGELLTYNNFLHNHLIIPFRIYSNKKQKNHSNQKQKSFSMMTHQII